MDRLSINPNISSEPLPSSSKVKGKGFGQRLKKAIEECRQRHNAGGQRVHGNP